MSIKKFAKSYKYRQKYKCINIEHKHSSSLNLINEITGKGYLFYEER